MEWAHIARRNREIGQKFGESKRAYLEYRKAYRAWSIALINSSSDRVEELASRRDVCARKASKSLQEAGRALKVLAWWWTFGECQ